MELLRTYESLSIAVIRAASVKEISGRGVGIQHQYPMAILFKIHDITYELSSRGQPAVALAKSPTSTIFLSPLLEIFPGRLGKSWPKKREALGSRWILVVHPSEDASRRNTG